MAKTQKPVKKSLPVYLYRVSKSGPNRLHIDIPSKDRQKFKPGGLVVVMKFEEYMHEQLQKAWGIRFKMASPKK